MFTLAGKCAAVIAKHLRRTEEAISNRAQKLGISFRRSATADQSAALTPRNR